jgi:hypothetical protein
MAYPYPVFPYTEAEFDFWPRPAIGTASNSAEAGRLIHSVRDALPEMSGMRLIRRSFCSIWPGHCAETIARGNHIPKGTWELCERPVGKVIEVTGWFLAGDEEAEKLGRCEETAHG